MPAPACGTAAEEVVEVLASSGAIRIERIVSCGQVTPEGQWYDQATDEWVALLQGSARLGYDDGRTRQLAPGDWLLIPAGQRHRVIATSSEPPCIWLAVHGDLSAAASPAAPQRVAESLSDGRLTLRRQRVEHAQALHQAAQASMAELSRWMPWCQPKLTQQDVARWLSAQRGSWQRGEAYEFAIFDAQTAKLLGGAGLNRLDEQSRSANLGYWVRTDATNQGIATASARLLKAFARDSLQLERIEILVAVGNHASLRVAHKLGAIQEARLRQRLRLGNGARCDAHLLALLL